MSDFTDAQARMRSASAALANAEASVALARRTRNAKVRPGAEDSDVAAEAKQLNAARATLAAAQQEMKNAAAGFAAFRDPSTNLARWASAYPIALLPVRIETRFMTDEDGVPQLCVRVYPDDCWIDTFEPDLSASELNDAKSYWRSMWRAGGVEADRRAAWHALATAHGSGRAGYIVDTYKPVNPGDLHGKTQPTDVNLVIPTQTPLGVTEADAVGTYWTAAWLADGDARQTNVALTALQARVGVTRAAELVANYEPFNVSDSPASPLTRQDVNLTVTFIVFAADPMTSPQSWTRAPRLANFPDCFVVLGFTGSVQTLFAVGGQITLPVYVAPDPEADPAESIHPDPASGDLFIPDQLKWTVDFAAAVAAGMGLRIELTAEQAQSGFDRLLVLGLQLSSSAQDGQLAFSELLQHHASGTSGLALLPQGTPTHNTADNASGFGRLEDPDASFDDRNETPLFTVTSNPLKKRDGQWLAEALGVSPSVFYSVHGADGMDQAQARAMQRALWPATLGYWMDKLLAPVFSDDTVEATRWYVTNFVSGRGSVPPIRIGGQPYGVLPTTAFSRIGWLGDRITPLAGVNAVQRAFLTQLYRLLQRIDPDWTSMSQAASYVGKTGDAQQILLDIIGLHPDSAEFHSRYAETLSQLYNTVNLAGLGASFAQAIEALIRQLGGSALLAGLGYAGSQQPPILAQLYDRASSPISTVIDDQPSSETTPVRSYTVDGRNYLHWLLDAARTSLDALRAEQGFLGNQTPQALLYLYLRQALMLGYFDTSYQLHKSAGFLSPESLAAMKPEPAFVHVDPQALQSESRFAALYKQEPRITGSSTRLVSDYITAYYSTLPEATAFSDQLVSLALLADVPTAALERLFAEHVDIVSYRLDSWLLGLVNVQLAAMRSPGDGKAKTGTGLYLGAYAWVENLRPSSRALTQVVKLDADLAAEFRGQAPLTQDAGNGGYIHAPSIAHARTAAVLRSGYLANASAQNPSTMSVNLSSDRVRLALSVLEGIRNGQSLGALLGYRFERGLHDDYGLAEVDSFIYPLRLAFPLVAGAIDSTPIPPGTPIQAVEARNVVDGRKLVEHIRSTSQTTYPFGIATLPAATAAQNAAITSEAGRLIDAYDSVADLALAEGVHQAVQGNFDRVAATLDAYASSSNPPPDPEVVQTPLPRIGLTHRVAVHFRAGLPPPANATPRATAEPALDDWLQSVFPDLATVACTVIWTDPVTQTAKSAVVHLADLGLRPIDILALVRPDSSPAMTELDDRVWSFVLAQSHPRTDARLQIQYATAPSGSISVFAFSALVRAVSALLTRSRVLKVSDVVLAGSASTAMDGAATIDRNCIAAPLRTLQNLLNDTATFVTNLSNRVPNHMPDPIPATTLDPLVQQIDALVAAAAALLERAARFGLPQAGWGSTLGFKRDAFADLISAVKALVDRWDGKLADCNNKLAAYNTLPVGTTDTDRLKALRSAELTISTVLAPLPSTPAALQTTVQGKADAFKTLRDEFNALLTTQDSSFSQLISSVAALPSFSQFDNQAFDLAGFESRVVVEAQDLLRIMKDQQTQITKRFDATQSQLTASDNAAATSDRTQALQVAAKALFGDSFTLYPEFAPDPARAAEWSTAYAASTNGTLVQYLTQTAGVDFPVDEWLAGVARVRPAMRAWETVVNLTTSLGVAEPTLQPVQFPFEANAPWLALQFPSDYVLSSDRLLYTAQYSSEGFAPGQKLCGLRLDEWSEFVPAKAAAATTTYCDTGIVFNYDRPNNEAPQSILLVTPASPSAQWQWPDLVGALNETLDLAKKRALEPAHIDPEPYACFLPATVMAATMYGISITTSLAAANGVFGRIQAQTSS
jgi:hypothetical protein